MPVEAHHSLSDWVYCDYSLFELSSFTFVSGPYSIAHPKTKTGYWQTAWLALGPELGYNVPHGVIATWIWLASGGTNIPRWFFRAQALPPDRNSVPANCYYFNISQNNGTLQRRVNGVNTQLAVWNWDPIVTQWQWHHIALTFETKQEQESKWLHLTVEREINGEWLVVKECDDNQNLWEASSVNRLGFSVGGGAQNENYKTRLDDTEVWKRKET